MKTPTELSYDNVTLHGLIVVNNDAASGASIIGPFGSQLDSASYAATAIPRRIFIPFTFEAVLCDDIVDVPLQANGGAVLITGNILHGMAVLGPVQHAYIPDILKSLNGEEFFIADIHAPKVPHRDNLVTVEFAEVPFGQAYYVNDARYLKVDAMQSILLSSADTDRGEIEHDDMVEILKPADQPEQSAVYLVGEGNSRALRITCVGRDRHWLKHHLSLYNHQSDDSTPSQISKSPYANADEFEAALLERLLAHTEPLFSFEVANRQAGDYSHLGALTDATILLYKPERGQDGELNKVELVWWDTNYQVRSMINHVSEHGWIDLASAGESDHVAELPTLTGDALKNWPDVLPITATKMTDNNVKNASSPEDNIFGKGENLYRVSVTHQATQSAYIKVRASSVQEAEEIAIQAAQDTACHGFELDVGNDVYESDLHVNEVDLLNNMTQELYRG